MTRVKICGITNLEDAMATAAAGADAVGFIFADSKRCVTIEQAFQIAVEMPPFVTKVGVFVGESKATLRSALHNCLDMIQLHGDESPEFCAEIAASGFAGRIIKAIHLRHEADLENIDRYRDASAIVLDSGSQEERGGTGRTCNWDLARQAVGRGKPVILAGGLTPENVTLALEQVRPYGVDVGSGVESSPGKKDLAKMKEFIARVRAYDTK